MAKAKKVVTPKIIKPIPSSIDDAEKLEPEAEGVQGVNGPDDSGIANDTQSIEKKIEPVNTSPRRYTPPVVEKENTPTIMYGRNGRDPQQNIKQK